MAKKQEILDTFDESCRGLYEKCVKYHPVEFVQWENNYGGAKILKKAKPISAEIYYYTNMPVSAFAHELLHVLFGYIMGQNECMYKIDSKNENVKLLFNFCDELGNQIEHYIFYKMYINLGFDRELFFSKENFDQYEYNEFSIRGIKRGDKYSLADVKNYFTAASHFLFYPIRSKYKSFEKDLKKLDKELFSVFDDLRQAIKNLDIKEENKETLQNAYEQFAIRLVTWIESKQFCVNF